MNYDRVSWATFTITNIELVEPNAFSLAVSISRASHRPRTTQIQYGLALRTLSLTANPGDVLECSCRNRSNFAAPNVLA